MERRALVLAAVLFSAAHSSDGATHNVDIVGFAFAPSSVNAIVGDTVVWTERDSAFHTSTSDTGLWDSGNLSVNQSFPFTFNAAGTFPYFCRPHPGMRGTVTVTGGANQPPVVSITNPGNNSSFPAPANLTIEATASDPDGSIAQVQFFDGSTALGVDNTPPYSVTASFAGGNHVLTAVATDNAGATTTSTPVNITVTAPNQPPAVSITRPANNTSFSGPTNLLIEATASDADGSIVRVEFFSGSTSLGVDDSAAYSVTANFAVGDHVLTAVATDNAGAMTASAPVNITVAASNQPPIVSISSPTNNASFLGPTNLIIEADASDPGGSITQVQFFDGATSLGVDSSSPYSVTASLTVGNHVLTAVATDNASAMSTSAPVTIVVTAPNQAPIVAISQPTNNASFLGPTNLTIEADANDADGSITRVEFLNGSASLGVDNDAPYSINANFPVGSHVLTAIATDNAGVAAISAPVNITIRSAPVVITNSILNGANLELAWSGGIGPFTVQQKLSLTDGPWTNIVATASRNASIPATERTAFFRIADTASQPPALFRARP